ncbi:MAG TPA: sigma-70 family RNA polymerase sigma factor [Thermomicrobiales bacterium]|jgi:RNA polymerase sigma-70 factor (ECF subfamily)|nr:sigma-70 family RNA polymerase sigma factor [Thermomicrobiales bacterium]
MSARAITMDETDPLERIRPLLAGQGRRATQAASVVDPASLPDADLVALARLEPDRFAVLYERYFEPVHGYCRRRLADPATAEDACAAVFSRAFAALGSCQQPDRFRSWLFTIAHHEVTDRYRARQPATDIDAVAWTLRDPDRTPEEQAIAADQRRTLYAALDALPPDQRHVIELKLSGLTGPEIATIIGRRHGAIRALQHRAFQRLRTLLAEPVGDDPIPPESHGGTR